MLIICKGSVTRFSRKKRSPYCYRELTSSTSEWNIRLALSIRTLFTFASIEHPLLLLLLLLLLLWGKLYSVIICKGIAIIKRWYSPKSHRTNASHVRCSGKLLWMSVWPGATLRINDMSSGRRFYMMYIEPDLYNYAQCRESSHLDTHFSGMIRCEEHTENDTRMQIAMWTNCNGANIKHLLLHCN